MAEGQAVASEVTCGGDNASAAIAMENKLLENLPACRRFLVPSDIVSDLLIMFQENERSLIREKLLLVEESNRVEAVNNLMGEVLAHGEDGFNLLLNALRGEVGELPDWWNEALEPSERSQSESIKEEQCTGLMDAFEGQVIRKISEGELKAILLKLTTKKVLKRTDMEQVRLKLSRDGKEKATQFMITCLRRSGDNWAWELLLVLVQVKPDLVRKMDPVGGHSEEDENENTSGDEADEDGGQGPGGQGPGGRDSGSSSSSSEADLSDDDSDRSFSDDDEKKDRDTEKNRQMKRNRESQSGQPKDLCLRAYQVELAAFALQGHNTIICAPTGSGKTRVAVYIVRQHLTRVVLDGRQPKIAFLARTVPLVTQQHKNFEKYLPNCKTLCITGESDHSMHLHNLLPSYDIVVMTPKVLENHLKPEKIESLAAFSLLIFDECHHTRKGEPYNSLMKSYLKSKKGKQKNLPQIVGLTASIGVERATTVSEAVESILNIMGNMDVTYISTVKENKKELEDTVPKPEEGHKKLVSREDDEISNKIKDIMENLQTMLVDSGADLEKKAIDDLLMKAPFDKASQQYGQWAVTIRNEVRLLNMSTHDPNTKKGRNEELKRQLARDVQVLADALVAYNEALEVHDLTRPQDVLQHLQHKIEQKMSKDETTECENQVLGLYKGDLKKTLLKCKMGNPNLDTLGKTLIKHLSKTDEESDEMSDEKSRIIIFVRTRATCKALCDWLNSHPEHVLRQLKAMPFTGTAAHQDRGGMTQSDQETAIDKFRCGAVRVLVTTSVGEEGIDIPECNLVIKYNHVGNEVTTIQTRGRSRKRGGRAILMAQPKILMQEALNQSRAVMMYQAIERVDAMSAEEVVESVQRVQKKILEKDEIQSIVRRSIAQTRRRETFSLQCCHCHDLTVAGENLRTINDSHHIILDRAIMQQVKIRPKKPKKLDEILFSGQVVCKKCKNHLGQILNYEGIDFITVGIRSWTLLDKDNTTVIYRRWRDVPYDIPELTPEEIKDYLDSEGDDEPSQARGATGGDI